MFTWRDIAMNVLISGGTGFIGSRLALRYLERGHAVTVLSGGGNAARAATGKLIEAHGGRVVLGSVTNRDEVFHLAQGIDVVYHLAAAQHEADVPDQFFWDVNVTGTKHVLEASHRAGVRRFIHASTSGVYGRGSDGPLDEGSPAKPDNIYGVTKLAGEKLAQSYQEHLPDVVLRISEAYGPGDLRLLKLFKAIRKNLFFVIGDGRNMHHPIYIDDLIDSLCAEATVDEAVGKIFVLAGKEPLSTNEMVEIIAGELGRKVPRRRLPLAAFSALAAIMETTCRPLNVQPPLHRRRMDFFRKNLVFRQEQALKHIGHVPKYSFREGVAESKKWYEQEGYL
jgi:nucleoside-diphosphate-sugar epimerase